MLNNNDHDLLVAINEQVTSMYKRLFGEESNPGEIESLKSRTRMLEEFRWKLIGALTLLGIVTTGNIWALIHYFSTSIIVTK